ncbi:MAG: hypothetical protein EBZ13_06730 [Planctomycetia bacterium]|nr:hypothetical protein [Planctomycetia bacterium]
MVVETSLAQQGLDPRPLVLQLLVGNPSQQLKPDGVGRLGPEKFQPRPGVGGGPPDSQDQPGLILGRKPDSPLRGPVIQPLRPGVNGSQGKKRVVAAGQLHNLGIALLRTTRPQSFGQPGRGGWRRKFR